MRSIEWWHCRWPWVTPERSAVVPKCPRISAEMSTHWCRNVLVPKCLGTEVSWVRSVRLPCDEMHVWRVDRVTSWLIATGGEGGSLPPPRNLPPLTALWPLGLGFRPFVPCLREPSPANTYHYWHEPHSVPVSEITASRTWRITATILSSMYCRPTT